MFEFLKFNQRKERAEPYNKNAMNLWLKGECMEDRYIRLVDSPEVKSAIEKVAEIVSTMTIHLMQNDESGDIRLKNGLSKKIDINPNQYMNRQLFVSWIVQEMLLHGNAIVLPKIGNGRNSEYLEDLVPIVKNKRTINDLDSYGYNVNVGNVVFSDDEVLNFRLNPDLDRPWIGKGQEVLLRDFVDNLGQANATTKDFMQNKMLPNIIVSVQGMTADMDNEDGRNELERRFLTRSRDGQPWIVPAGLMNIEQIRPTTLQDIAIDKTIKLNKETIASILGVPAFILGVGTFNNSEYNHFIKTKVAVISKAIEQELTKKLLIRDDWYFKFNTASLLSYDLPEIAEVYSNLYTKGLVTGNEVRDKIGMSTMPELDDLVILENFIPKDKIGDQEKLQKGGVDEEEL